MFDIIGIWNGMTIHLFNINTGEYVISLNINKDRTLSAASIFTYELRNWIENGINIFYNSSSRNLEISNLLSLIEELFCKEKTKEVNDEETDE